MKRNFPNVKRVLLIEPPDELTVGFNATVLVEPLGLEFIAGAIRDIAEVQIYDMRVDSAPLAHILSDFNPDVVGIRINYTVAVNKGKEVAAEIKRLMPEAIVVVGGHHISLAPKDAHSPDIDAIVVGEGENTFRNLILRMQKYHKIEATPDVIFRNDNGELNYSNIRLVPKNSLKEFDSRYMNERPAPARELVEKYRGSYFYLYHVEPFSIEQARGCIYRCSFCSVHEFFNGEYRVQGSQRTIDELARLPPKSWVNFVDDLAFQELPPSVRTNFPVGYDPSMDLAEELIALNLGHRYWAQVRADNVVRNPKKFEKLARAGLDTVLVGLESFSQNDLNAVSKGTKLDDNVRAVQILQDLGIRIWGAMIVFQHWTQKDFENLKRTIVELKIQFPQYTILTPLPRTLDWRKTEANLITRESKYFDFLHSVLPTALSPQEFYAEYAQLWRVVGGGGTNRVREMRSEVSTTPQSIKRFLRQYKTLSNIETYKDGIELLEAGKLQK